MRISRRAIWRGVMGSVCLSALALLGVILLSVRQELLRAWRQIAPGALAAGGLLIAAVWSAKAGRMWVIANAMGARIGFRRFLAIYLATCFVSHITPFSAGGVPMQVYLIHREGMPVGAATALTAVDLGLNSLVFLVAIPAALLLGQGGLTYQVPGWLGWVVGLLGALILGGLAWRRRRKPSPPKGEPLLARWRHEYELFRQGLGVMAGCGYGPFLAATALTFAYWFFYLLLAPVILWGLGVRIPWGYVLGAQLIFNFLQVLLPTPGGSGGSELLLLGVFAPVLGRGEAGVFVLMWKTYTFYSTLVLGGLCFWKLLRPGRREPESLESG